MAQTFVTSIQGTTGVRGPFPVNVHISPANLGICVYQTLGTGMYIVQHSFDSPFDRDPVSGNLKWTTAVAYMSAARWLNHPVLSSLTSTADGNYAYPPAAVRLNVVSADASANFELRIIQAGIAGN